MNHPDTTIEHYRGDETNSKADRNGQGELHRRAAPARTKTGDSDQQRDDDANQSDRQGNPSVLMFRAGVCSVVHVSR